MTQHIPELGEHLIRYYGWYSNKKRGQRAKVQPPTPEGSVASPRAPSAREARKRWAALIKQVYETDPLSCPKCGSTMKIIGFIERHQGEVIRLRQGYGGTGRKDSAIPPTGRDGLWEEAPARDPPAAQGPSVG